jgi:uncharacterized protein
MWIRILLFIVIFGFAEYYSFIVIRSALRTLPQSAKLTVTTVYILLSMAAWLGIIFFRRIDWAAIPHMPRNIYVAFTLGLLIGKTLVLVIMLADEARRLLVWIVNMFQTSAAPQVVAEQGITRSVFLMRLALILGGTALAGFLYGITNRYNYNVRRVKLAFKDLPEAFRGMKIVQVSDIHSGSFDNHKAVQHGADLIMQENADIIFFTGDLVNNKATEVEPYMDIFSTLRAPMGVYSVLGNHDYGDYVQWESKQAKITNLETLKGHHASMGWRLLMNEHVILEKGQDKIAIIGIENWGARANFPKYGSMSRAYAGLPEKNIPFKILLSHDPSHWDAEVRNDYKDVNLTLAGHTHGMQFGIEIPGLKWSPVKYVYKNWAGHYKEDEQHLYVNRGFGFLGYPGRLGILPEITVIELV